MDGGAYRNCRWSGRSAGLSVVVAAALSIAGGPAHGQTPASPTSTAGVQTGLALPRYASLKSDRVNMRSGPATDTPILWVYRRAGLPVEVLKEVEGWRQIRDGEGTTGWVSSVLISNRRTVQIAPWDAKKEAGAPPIVELKADTSASSATMALLEAGVIATLTSCASGWCRVSAGEAQGYIEQKRLWGVYPDETVK